jgi:acetyl esterase/lipase
MRGQHYGPEPDGTSDPTGYWLFEPTGPRAGTPVPSGPLPLVIFLHGYTGTDPEIYHAWLDHLVRRGAIVIYPDWQPWDASQTKNEQAFPNAVAAIRAALTELGNGEHAQPDLHRVALMGHSFGGMIGVQYAASAAAQGLPVPTAILLAMPACGDCPLPDLTTLPATTRLLVVAVQDDPYAATEPQRLWPQLTAVPLEQRDFITIVPDTHQDSPLSPDHGLPATTLWGPLDAYDWYGTWKWLDALMTCSFDGQDCQVALGNTPEQRFLGTWSDGVPVTEPQVTDDPELPASAGTPTT